SGRDAAGTFIDAATLAGVPHRIIVIDDARGIQTALLGRLAEVVAHHDRIDESRTAAEVADAGELSTLAELGTGDGVTAGETWAIINAPKTTSALAETVAGLQPHVSTIIVIGRSAAMSRAENKELAPGLGRVGGAPVLAEHRISIDSRPPA